MRDGVQHKLFGCFLPASQGLISTAYCAQVLVRNKDSLTLEVQAGCLSLLSAMLAFSLDTHSAVMATELPACLVEVCR